MNSTILYLDDESACLDLFRDVFGREYDVRVARTPDEARRMLRERAADLVISDQQMPGMSGTDFLREVSVLCPESRRMLLTGRVTVGSVLPDVGDGLVQIFAPKPWTAEEMREMLERARASPASAAARKL